MNLRTAANLIESEYRARKASAEARYRDCLARYPELLEAEKAIRAAIIDGKSEAEMAKLERAKTGVIEKLGLSHEFNAPPRCEKCLDSGLLDGKYCDCVRRRAAKETVELSTPPYTFDDCDFSVFGDAELGNIKPAYAAMRIFCEKFPSTKNINVLLLGTVGTGKTFLAACMANAIESRGYGCLFLSAFRFNDICLKYHTSFEATRVDGLNALIDTDLLVIDDLGTESILKNVTLEYLYTVISERMSKGRHTLITTNLSAVQLEARYGERIASRLFTDRVCLTVGLTGKDLRR